MFTPSSTWDLLIPLMVQRPPQEAETKLSLGWLERGIRAHTSLLWFQPLSRFF